MSSDAPGANFPSTLITSHINPDFDAMASILAAQKLYPNAGVILPGSMEKNLKLFFIQSVAYLFNIVALDRISISAVRQLVLVDTRRRNRIGDAKAILDNPDLEIHIYDHHLKKEDDIGADKEVYQKTGATITILAKILQANNIALSSEEATVMCLGLYEATGSFSFPSTTEADFTAAAYFLSSGADLTLISNMMAREFGPEQIGLLNDMMQASHSLLINGVEVVVTSVIADNYFPDFSALVQKMAKMENIEALFVLGFMGNKVYLVARSRTTDVDVGDILAELGGDGHATSASAVIQGKTIVQVEQDLMGILYHKINPRRLARHLMSSPAIMAKPETTIREAKHLLNRYAVNALLVGDTGTEKKGYSGYITRQIIEKALYHHLNDLPVTAYMNTEISSVGPDADISEIQNKIIGNKQRLLPVVSDSTVVGVVTRTDLLNTLVQQNQKPLPPGKTANPDAMGKRIRMVENLMHQRLSKPIMTILSLLGEVADTLSCNIFVVGGFVRDMFLHRKNEDVDVVVEGDGVAFARVFSEKYKARIHTHEKFGTAVIIFTDSFKIDVASARMEYYQHPASLPVVEMSSIKMDMFRRDFTINTLAIQLNPEKFGRLIDFFSGQKDITAKMVRVLHNLSFVEDPTRVFRALRFEQRFGFTIGKLTASLIENAIKMDFFKQLSGKRIYTELVLILKEENPVPAVMRLVDYDLFHIIHPAIIIKDDLHDLLENTRKAIDWHDLLFTDASYQRWTIYFMAVIRHCDADATRSICERLMVPPKYTRLFSDIRIKAQLHLALLEQETEITNAEIFNQLNGFETEEILYMVACTTSETAKKRISLYHTQLRRISLSISGKTLMGIGMKPGPMFREILQAVLEAKLNGSVATREDEISLALEMAKQ
ncbi:CBS domain-containing protein [Desulfosarcina sp. OttesenSCG-928-A07]|nr:CBS domain-containing protein [Desulfosarcina sp. OttesenSCG-928-G17]MDL2329665.1 CBS domain-containing protein [Desulfosarcina sp. OttesenSCG-928-A07]